MPSSGGPSFYGAAPVSDRRSTAKATKSAQEGFDYFHSPWSGIGAVGGFHYEG